MKTFIAAAGLLCATVTPAFAAEVRFVGSVVITDQKGVCPEGDYVGQRYSIRFRPRNVADNPPHSDLNFFGEAVTFGHRLRNGSFSGQFKKVDAVYVGGGSGPYEPVHIRFATQEPGNIVTGTEFLSITGEIRGFDFQPKCTHTFRIGATRQEP